MHGWKAASSGRSRADYASRNSRNALDSVFSHYLYSASCLGRRSGFQDCLVFRSIANLATVIIQEYFAAPLRLLNTKEGLNVAYCPECEADIELEEVEKGEIVNCPDCGVDLEVVGTDPVELELAPAEEEDWGE